MQKQGIEETHDLELLYIRDELEAIKNALFKKMKKLVMTEEWAYYLFRYEDEVPKCFAEMEPRYDMHSEFSYDGAMQVVQKLKNMDPIFAEEYCGPYRDENNESDSSRTCPITGKILWTNLTNYGIISELEHFESYVCHRRKKIWPDDWYWLYRVADGLVYSEGLHLTHGPRLIAVIDRLEKKRKIKIDRTPKKEPKDEE